MTDLECLKKRLGDNVYELDHKVLAVVVEIVDILLDKERDECLGLWCVDIENSMDMEDD